MIVKTANVPEIREAIVKQGLEVQTNTPEEFASFIRSGRVQNAKLVKARRVEYVPVDEAVRLGRQFDIGEAQAGRSAFRMLACRIAELPRSNSGVSDSIQEFGRYGFDSNIRSTPATMVKRKRMLPSSLFSFTPAYSGFPS